MSTLRRRIVYLFLGSALSVLLGSSAAIRTASGQSDRILITGRLEDRHGGAVAEAAIALRPGENEPPLAETSSHEDGTWALLLDSLPQEGTLVTVDRHHFETREIDLGPRAIDQLNQAGVYHLGTLTLERRITLGFWVAGAVFVGVLALIAFEVLHSTTAALVGLSILFLSSFVGAQFDPGLYIFDFERALTYINWEVIFLVLGMMIVIAIIERTGIFQWTAFQAYRISRGRAAVLVVILMAVTALASALLDNFTTMLLMTPISLQIGLAMGINPLALIIPEVLASNVGGISTLIGTPTNILIGAHAGISFTDFLVHQTVGVLVALALMAGFVLFHYREELAAAREGISPRLYQKLEENAAIEDHEALAKSGVVFALVLTGFVLGERFHVVPAVPAMVGATALLVWLNPDVQEMIKAVDWTTLVFFFVIFMVIGGVQEVGLVTVLAAGMAQLIGDSLIMGIFAMVFGAGTLSIAIANIPLAASMLPIVDFLSGRVPGASGKVLYYALSMGSAMGGNGFVISGEANLVTAGISRQAGQPVSFKEFMKVGIPVTYITLAAGFGWLVLHFVLLGG